jgi:hypothetical protein
LRKVREQTSFDGAGLLLQETFKQLADPIMLVDVLYCLLESQVVAKKLTQEEFCEGFFGDSLERALDALVGAISDFLPSTQRAAIGALWEQRTMAMELIQERIASIAAPRSGNASQGLKQQQDSRPVVGRSAKSSKRLKRNKTKS